MAPKILNVDVRAHETYIVPNILSSLPKSLIGRWGDRWLDNYYPSLELILKELERKIRIREIYEGAGSTQGIVYTTERSVKTAAVVGAPVSLRPMSCYFCQQNHLHHRVWWCLIFKTRIHCSNGFLLVLMFLLKIGIVKLF